MERTAANDGGVFRAGMMDPTTAISETNNGVVTTVTVIHHNYRNYGMTMLAIAAFALFAWALRRIFGRPGSH